MDMVELRYLATGGTIAVSAEYADRYVDTGKYARVEATTPVVAPSKEPEAPPPAVAPELPVAVEAPTPVAVAAPDPPKAPEEPIDYSKLLDVPTATTPSVVGSAKPVVHRRSTNR